MIKYETIVNKYYYKREDIDNIIEILKSTNYYINCTKEEVTKLVQAVDEFLGDIKVQKEKYHIRTT